MRRTIDGVLLDSDKLTFFDDYIMYDTSFGNPSTVAEDNLDEIIREYKHYLRNAQTNIGDRR